MGRVIHTDSPGKQRLQFMKALSLAVRELEDAPENNTSSRDLVAFIILSIEAINRTVDASAQAWEKRGYWLKADRFRLEWSWADRSSVLLKKAIYDDDWLSIASTLESVKKNISHVKVSPNHQLGTPWVGAWEKLVSHQ